MKKSLVIVAAALVLASACQKEQLVPEGNFSIKATREACVDTKATVSDAGAFAWVSNDVIGVYNGTGFSELTTTGSGASATFTGTVVGTPQTCAIFPSSVVKSTTSVTLPDSYVWKDGDAPTPMYAEYNASGLSFKHLGGLVKISLSGVLAGAREFVITADKDITGDYSFVEEGGYKVIKTAGNASNKSVKFTFDAPASDMVFYVPVPVGTYKFAVSLNDAGGNELWKYSGSSDNVVTRAKLIVMPTLTIVALPGSGEGSATSVTVPENYNGTFYLPETSSDVYVKLNNTTGYISLEYSGSSKPANVVIDAAGKTVSDLRIVLPDSHVQVLNGTYANITAQTSLSTLVLEKEVKITTATIEKGSATIASNNVGTVKVESSVQDKAKIVLAPTAVVTTISTESSAPIVIQKEGESQASVNTIEANSSTAIELQNGASGTGITVTGSGSAPLVNTSTSESTPGVEETTTVNANSQSALAYAFKKGYDVILSNNFDINVADNGVIVPEESSIILDLNGHTLTAGSEETKNIKVLGQLTIKDSGTDGCIKCATDYSGSKTGMGVIMAVGENAKVIVNGGTIDAVRENPVSKGQFAVNLYEGADFEINGGKIIAGWYAVSGNGNYKTQDTQITVNAGTLESTADYAMYLPHSGSTVINDGATVIGGAGAICIRSGNLTINGGNIVCEGDGNTGETTDGTGLVSGTNMTANAGIRIEAKSGYAALGTVEITGGSIEATKAPGIVTNSPLTIRGGKISTTNYALGGIRLADSKSNVTIINTELSSTRCVVMMGGTLTINQGTFTSPDNCNISIRGGKAVINEGTFSSVEGCIHIFGDGSETIKSEVEINGGTFTASDNAVILGNGTSGYYDTKITVNGGTFNGRITTSGYMACGIYHPQRGQLNIKGGTFNIEGGSGIVMRGGTLDLSEGVVFNFIKKDGLTEGWVGDKKTKLPVDKEVIADKVCGGGYADCANITWNVPSGVDVYEVPDK